MEKVGLGCIHVAEIFRVFDGKIRERELLIRAQLLNEYQPQRIDNLPC
jgi:hypothetical protein